MGGVNELVVSSSDRILSFGYVLLFFLSLDE